MEQQKSPYQALDELQKLLSSSDSQWAQSILKCSKTQLGNAMPKPTLFVFFCAKEALVIYLQYLRSRQPGLFEGKVGRLTLTTVIENTSANEMIEDPQTEKKFLNRLVEVTKFLTKNGLDINDCSPRQVYSDTALMMTIWEWYLRFLDHPMRRKEIPWTSSHDLSPAEQLNMDTFVAITKILLQAEPTLEDEVSEDEIFWRVLIEPMLKT